MDSKETAQIFDATLVEKEGLPAINGKVMKISTVGMLFQMIGTTRLMLGDLAQVVFKLPNSEFVFSEQVKVMKTYLRWAEAKAGQGYSSDIKSNVKVQLLEFHFLQITAHRKGLIETYLEQSGPKE